MASLAEQLRSIPGTVVFDAAQSRRGYALNMCCLALCDAANREQFRNDPNAYISRFALSAEQREAMLARDYNRMIGLGGNIYYIGKIAAVDGKNFQQLASLMSGIPEDELKAIMMAGGRAHDTELRTSIPVSKEEARHG